MTYSSNPLSHLTIFSMKPIVIKVENRDLFSCCLCFYFYVITLSQSSVTHSDPLLPLFFPASIHLLHLDGSNIWHWDSRVRALTFNVAGCFPYKEERQKKRQCTG